MAADFAAYFFKVAIAAASGSGMIQTLSIARVPMPAYFAARSLASFAA